MTTITVTKQLLNDDDFMKDYFRYYNTLIAEQHLVTKFNNTFNDEFILHTTDELPPMMFYDIEVTQGTKGIPDPSKSEFPVDSIQTYNTINNEVFLQITLLPSHRRKWGRTDEMASKNLLDAVLTEYTNLTKKDERYLISNKDFPKFKLNARFSEEDTLFEFWDYLKTWKPVMLCGFNSRNFDDPYMFNRTRKVFGKEFVNIMSRFGEIQIYNEQMGKYSLPDFELVDIQQLMMPVDSGGLALSSNIDGGLSLDNYSNKILGVGKLKLAGSFLEQYKFMLKDLLTYGTIDTINLPNLWQKVQINSKLFPLANSLGSPSAFALAGKTKMYLLGYDYKMNVDKRKYRNFQMLNNEFGQF